MSLENKIIRLASIDAVLTKQELPERFLEERKGIIEKLVKEKMIIVKGAKKKKYEFPDSNLEALYKDSFKNF